MKLVRVIKNWKTPDILRQTPGGKGLWGSVKFTLEPVDECDYVIVFNRITEDVMVNCIPSNIYAMIQEPYVPGIFDWVIEGHDLFHKVFTHHIFNNDPKYIATQTCLPWHVNKTYDELKSMAVPPKHKTISWITTNKTVFSGHTVRMAFLEKIKMDTGLNVDIFGYGINPIGDKWNALETYKYSLAIENSSSPHYWTEKLADCFLAYTLPIYFGCRNLEQYFPKESFIQIDINDFKHSKEVIRQAIHDNSWEDRLSAIIEARQLVLDKYQFFPFIAQKIEADQKNNKFPSHKGSIVLKPKETGKPMSPAKPLISVIVCTYNRQEMLPGCLDALINQNVDDHNYEVIIINNNSIDHTEEIGKKYALLNTNFSYYLQSKQGLSHARNLGLEIAKAEYIAYIDDDAIAPKNWIYTALQIMRTHKPDIFGGPAYPIFPSGKPEWYKDEYGIRGDMGETGWLSKGFIIGTNIFFKRELLIEYGGFDPNLGMKGNTIAYHEETKLIFRAFDEGKKIYYSKELAVKDVIPDYKKSLAFFIHTKYQAGKYGLDIWKYNFTDDDLPKLLELISKTMDEFDIALMNRDVEKYPSPENYIIEKLKNNFFQIGMMVEHFRKKLTGTP
jgi:glycosyltransferase involved in cell wall biosynthesis